MAPDRPDSPGEDHDWTDEEIAAFMADPQTRAALARGEEDIVAGRVVPHKKVAAWVRSWKTQGYRPYPREWFE